MESQLHINNLTSSHLVRFLESVDFYGCTKVSQLFLEFIIVLIRLNDSVRLLNGLGGPGNSPVVFLGLFAWEVLYFLEFSNSAGSGRLWLRGVVQGPYYFFCNMDLVLFRSCCYLVTVVVIWLHWGMMCEVCSDCTGSYVLLQ